LPVTSRAAAMAASTSAGAQQLRRPARAPAAGQMLPLQEKLSGSCKDLTTR